VVRNRLRSCLLLVGRYSNKVGHGAGDYGLLTVPYPVSLRGEGATVRDRRWPIHWVWLPIAVVVAVIGWSRFGWRRSFWSPWPSQ
jgi:hypothetical protein